MASKRRISYKWRLFMPTLILLWVLIIGMAYWQTTREKKQRFHYVEAQLDLVNNRIADAVLSGNDQISEEFLEFIDRFYVDNPIFDDIRITIYNRDWDVIKSVGTPIVLKPEDKLEARSSIIEREALVPSLNHAKYFYKLLRTHNGDHYIISALPLDKQLENYVNGDRTAIWAIVVGIALVMSIIIYYASVYFSRNITLLREFAKRTASDPAFIPGNDFPHDELGDVAREIVSIYNERAKVRRRLQHEHQVAIKAIEDRNLQKRQLTNNINHELKTPIGVIKGYLDTLVDTPDLDPDTQRHFIVKARQHANRLVDLIADVSAITRLQDGANLINTENFDYHDLVYSFANDVNESGVMGHMEFTFDVPIHTMVCGNMNLLNGMLLNLAKNSVAYSNGTTCTLQYNGLSEDGLMHSFSFYDDGVGVPKEAIPHMFERFYRVDSGRTRKAGGTGLGLAIVYNTVTAHGGTVECLNRPNYGLEVRFTLPRAGKSRSRDLPR